jgi:hypothetical protein
MSFFEKLYNKFHIVQNLFLKEKVFLKKKTYSSGKLDLKILKLFKNKFKGFYVDVGCYHPTKINNTYLLYNNHWRGVNIDVSKFSINLFDFWRPEDINICRAITNKNSYSTLYYQKEYSFLSTLSKKQANLAFQGKIKKKLIKCSTLTTILNETPYKGKKIDFLNIDAEGHDLSVLKSLNFKIYRPSCICVEDTDLYYKRIDRIEDSKIYKFLTKLNYRYIKSGVFDHIYFSI